MSQYTETNSALLYENFINKKNGKIIKRFKSFIKFNYLEYFLFSFGKIGIFYSQLS